MHIQKCIRLFQSKTAISHCKIVSTKSTFKSCPHGPGSNLFLVFRYLNINCWNNCEKYQQLFQKLQSRQETDDMKYLYFTLAKLKVSNVVVLSQNLLSNCQNLLFVLTSLQFHGNISVCTSFIRYDKPVHVSWLAWVWLQLNNPTQLIELNSSADISIRTLFQNLF